MLAAVEEATVARCGNEPWVHVVVDGTSLKLPDWKREKTPLGILNQQWWTRQAHKKRSDCQDRPLSEKETIHWVHSIWHATRALLQAGGPQAWFQVAKSNVKGTASGRSRCSTERRSGSR